MNPLELILKLLSGDVNVLDRQQGQTQPPLPPQPEPQTLRERMTKYRFPPRKPEDLSGMGY